MENIKNLKKEKVEWKKLEEVCKFQNGFAFPSNLFSSTGIPVIKINNVSDGKVKFDNYKCFESETLGINLEEYKILPNDILITMTGTTKIGYNYSENIGYLNQRVGKIIPFPEKIKNRFLFHLLLFFENKIYKLATGAGPRPNLSAEQIKSFKVPLPPLKKQAKIAAALDKFTELTEELTAREAQYNYYRKMLLSQEWIEREEGEEVEWKALEEIFDTRTGYTPSKKIKLYWENGTVDWFTIEDINQKGKNLETANVKISETGVKGKLFKGNSVVLSTNASVGKYALIKNDFTINQRFMVFTAKKEYSDFLNMEFAKYYFSQISEYCLKNLREGKFPSVDLKKLLKFKFPIPSLKTQKKIIDILDNFETLVNDIRQGLPREIELRQKQYYKTLLRISTNENKLKYL